LQPKIFWHLASTKTGLWEAVLLSAAPYLRWSVGSHHSGAPLRPGLPKDSWMLPRLASAAKTRTAGLGWVMGNISWDDRRQSWDVEIEWDWYNRHNLYNQWA
jgi:hypothetical protein